MNSQDLERIIMEEVRKVLAEQDRARETALPPDSNETLDPFACQGPACTIPDPFPARTAPRQLKPAAPPAVPPPSLEGPAVLLIFTGAKEKWDVLTQAFQNWREKGIGLDAVFSSSAHWVISPDETAALGIRAIDQPAELHKMMYHLSRYSAVFLPSFSRTHAAKLALGITDTVTLNLALSALAQKIPTYASTEGLDPTACIVCGNQVPGIQDVLNRYREQLATMGIKLLPAAEAVQAISRIVLNEVESGPDLIVSLVTEEDAARLKGPVVKAARGGLITPLAMELLQRRGIEVVIVPQK
ncbi:MAG: hypothetical protein HPY51_12555 [Candidatus Omnitrophica bacterium]|nr:hypothetical protein [Candidatus Omnitrophota bacterium]